MREILKALGEILEAGQSAALATVVATRGSTYRKPGACMLLSADGTMVGSVGGGCLEEDLLEIARRDVFPSGKSTLVVYDTMAAEEMVWGLNTGCNGVIEVLLAPAPHLEALALQIRELTLGPYSLVTELSGSHRRALLRPHGPAVSVDGSSAPAWDPDLRIRLDAAVLQAKKKSATMIYSPDGTAGRVSGPGDDPGPGDIRVFIESVLPSPRLFVFGAGHDAVPLVDLAVRLGWAVTVVDHRPGMLAGGHFQCADRAVVAHPSEAIRSAGVADGDFCMIMTHNYGHDKELLRCLGGVRPRYLGILGPQARTSQLQWELATEGHELPVEVRSVIASPLGLNIGGETPVEIALSALSEAQAIRYGRTGVKPGGVT